MIPPCIKGMLRGIYKVEKKPKSANTVVRSSPKVSTSLLSPYELYSRTNCCMYLRICKIVCTYVYVKLCTYHDLYGITLLFIHICKSNRVLIMTYMVLRYFLYIRRYIQFYIYVGTYNTNGNLENLDEVSCILSMIDF